MTTDWHKIADLLREAHDLIIDERNWCTHTYARTRDGKKTASSGATAVAWCALGAIRRVSTPLDEEAALTVALGHALPPRFFLVAGFNDDQNTTHGDVLDLYLRAIKWAEEQAS
jgi:hypothetical protein